MKIGNARLDGAALLRRFETMETAVGQRMFADFETIQKLMERNVTLERHLAVQCAETRRLVEEKALLLKQIGRLQADKQLLCTTNRVLSDELEEARGGMVKR